MHRAEIYRRRIQQYNQKEENGCYGRVEDIVYTFGINGHKAECCCNDKKHTTYTA